MEGWGAALAVLDGIARETMLFAAIGFLVGGVDDLAIDLVYLAYRLKRGVAAPRLTLDRFPLLETPGRIAVFIAAWDESRVIAAMLGATLARYDHPNYRLYVGAYSNDPATIDAVAVVAEGDGRVRLVIVPHPGPTTKADCLNAIWRALLRDEAAEGVRAKAVVLHDAEDLVHAGELRVIDRLIESHAVVQLPVLPLVVPGSPLVSGHYCDEFAEAHAKQLVVRQALGAALPLAGVGCALQREMIGMIARQRGGVPFDATSLTEDYELGLQVAALGGRGVIARVFERGGGPLVAVRAYFPATLDAAVRQKARWMVGIALAGWDRVGWSGLLDWHEHWMRMRDRRGPIAMLVLATAYAALVSWGLSTLAHSALGTAAPSLGGLTGVLLGVNAVLLVWRLGMRALFTGLAYGARAAAWSVPRAFVGNLVALLAARRALVRYIVMLRGAPPVWEKTAHLFPDDARSDAG